MPKVVNFNAGPAILPREVLQQVQSELLDFGGSGMSILEISHRSKDFEAVIHEAEALAKRLYGVPDGYRVLFLQGGASLQFSMVPMNLLPSDGCADYVLTGSWSQKAYDEAVKAGTAHVAASTKDDNFSRIPKMDEIRLCDKPAYVHITSNNTIYGTQWNPLPTFGDVPIVGDFSSDVFSRPVDIRPYALIYAGLQKNAGPAGATLVIIREDVLEAAPKSLPTMLRYAIHAKNNSLYNTPPVFSIYVSLLVMRRLETLGGLSAVAKANKAKAAVIYDVIDESEGFYKGHAEKDSRSLMNITFRLPDEELEKRFLTEAKEHGFVGLPGHRSVGGVRASVYNAMPIEGCTALADFMRAFRASVA